jgi:signal peptidase II
MHTKLRLWPWLTLGLLLLLADQLSKWWILSKLGYREVMVIIPDLLKFELTYNTGAAFSFLAGTAGAHWMFVGIALLAAIGIPVWMHKLKCAQWLLAVALTLIWSGAVGNLIDRLRFRHVVDFISVHWKDQWAYAIFNVADSAITVGAVCLIVYELFFAKKIEATPA